MYCSLSITILLCCGWLLIAVSCEQTTERCSKIITGDSENHFGKASCFKLNESSDIWKALSCVKISVNSSECEILHGPTLEDVEEDTSIVSLVTYAFGRMFSPKNSNQLTTVCLSPFEAQYIRVDNAKEEVCEINISTVLDKSCVACLLMGILIFNYAEGLSTSVHFYYTSGVGIGILASLLILTFLLSRLVPKKPAVYTILLGGWSFTAWIFRLLWNNWTDVLRKYYSYLFLYVAVTGLISFGFCYWKGPIESPRSQNLMKWTLQLVALLLIYNGSHLPMISLSVVLGAVVIKIQSQEILWKKMTGLKLWFDKPKPRRLLTEEEFKLQGEIETQKALEELRQYCSSPECSPWKTLSRIKTPDRFIKFMDGEQHVTDAEMTLHDVELSDSDDSDNASALITDDDDKNVSVDIDNNKCEVDTVPDPLISEDDSS